MALRRSTKYSRADHFERLDGTDPVLYAAHERDDGMWQFHSNLRDTTFREAALVSLRAVFTIDPTISQLADLPLGWHGWRQAGDLDWSIGPKDDD